jgi:HK97 family phage major capsid protein
MADLTRARGLARFRRPDGTFPPIAGADPIADPQAPAPTIESLEARQDELRSLIQTLDAEFAGQVMPEDRAGEWNDLNTEFDGNVVLLDQLRARRDRLTQLAGDPANTERGTTFHTARPGTVRGDDIYDLSTIRMTIGNPQDALGELRDRAMRSVEQARFPYQVDDDSARARIEHLIDTLDMPDREDVIPGEVSRRILMTGSPTYQRAFKKYMAAKALTPEEQRALSVGTGSAGGFAIVYTLDPTIIPTSSLSVNPFREFASVETIAGTNEWRGVTSAGVTAAYAAEAAAATDNSPTLAQPSLVVAKAHCFVPASIELTQDWGSLQSDIAALIMDAKDDLEATQFATGTYGAGTNPGGLITGATTTVTAGGTAAFAVADLYKLWEALPPRFRARAVFLANLFTYNKVRQFDTAGGASLWVQNLTQGLTTQAGPNARGTLGASLLSKPAYESTAMAAALTTGSKILAVGDGRYFKVVDRVGMDVEVIPHLFGASQGNLPTGQRGFYAYWRNTSKVLDPAGWRVLVTG